MPFWNVWRHKHSAFQLTPCSPPPVLPQQTVSVPHPQGLLKDDYLVVQRCRDPLQQYHSLLDQWDHRRRWSRFSKHRHQMDVRYGNHIVLKLFIRFKRVVFAVPCKAYSLSVSQSLFVILWLVRAVHVLSTYVLFSFYYLFYYYYYFSPSGSY